MKHCDNSPCMWWSHGDHQGLGLHLLYIISFILSVLIVLLILVAVYVSSHTSRVMMACVVASVLSTIHVASFAITHNLLLPNSFEFLAQIPDIGQFIGMHRKSDLGDSLHLAYIGPIAWYVSLCVTLMLMYTSIYAFKMSQQRNTNRANSQVPMTQSRISFSLK